MSQAILKVHQDHLVEVNLRVNGFIFNDPKGRFKDGTNVTTSTVQKVIEDSEPVTIETRNTIYTVERVTPEVWRELIIQDTCP